MGGVWGEGGGGAQVGRAFEVSGFFVSQLNVGIVIINGLQSDH